jgi:hypothetical protein
MTFISGNGRREECVGDACQWWTTYIDRQGDRVKADCGLKVLALSRISPIIGAYE